MSDIVAKISIDRMDPRLALIADRQRDWRAGGFLGSPAFWSWHVRRVYSNSELENASYFQIIAQSTIEISYHDLESSAASSRRGSRMRRLVEQQANRHGIARMMSGEIVLSDSIAKILDEESTLGVSSCSVIECESRFLCESSLSYVRLVPPTIVGADPFSVEYVNDADFIFPISELSFSTVGIPLSDRIYFTAQKSGYRLGDIMPCRLLVVERGVMNSMRDMLTESVAIERAHCI